METKRLIRRNLPINDTYRIINSYYTGSLADGYGCSCDNCNKIITNVAEIENNNGKRFNVGLDCAETLSGLDYFEFNQTKADFNEAKAIRAKVNKAVKEGKQIEFLINYNGNLNVFCSGKFSETKKMDYATKFLPDYVKKVSNPEKIGYTYNEIELDLSKLKGRKNASGLNAQTFDLKINDNQYSLNVRVTEKPFFSRMENKDSILYRNEYDLILNSGVIETKEAFILIDLNYRFNNFISKHEYSLFNNLQLV